MYRDLFSCEGKVAMVTGGRGLIGKEIVRALDEFGARVYVADIRDPGSGEAGSQVGPAPSLRHLSLDITSEKSVEEAVATIVEREKRIDLVVNSAYPRTGDWGVSLEKVPFESWKENLNNHLGGYFLCCQKVAEIMKRQGGGALINLASTYGVVAPDPSIYEGTEMAMPVAYAPIKAGIIALTRYFATHYGAYNVRANSISPGGIFDGQPASFVERYALKTPLKRMGRPADVVGAVIYLASDASSYVTGHNLMVDGGWTAW